MSIITCKQRCSGLIQYQTCWNIFGCSELWGRKRHNIGSLQKDRSWGAGSRLINFHMWYLTSSQDSSVRKYGRFTCDILLHRQDSSVRDCGRFTCDILLHRQDSSVREYGRFTCDILLHRQDSSVRECGRSYFPMMADVVFPFSYFLELGRPSIRTWIHIACLEAGQTYGSIIAQRRHQKWQSMTSRGYTSVSLIKTLTFGALSHPRSPTLPNPQCYKKALRAWQWPWISSPAHPDFRSVSTWTLQGF